MIVTSLDVAADVLADATGWAIEPQGACKGEVCVPLRAGTGTTARALAERLGMPIVGDADRGMAHFELGQHLYLLGEHAAAVPHWRRAHELFPANWTYMRQAWNLDAADPGAERRYDGSWLADVQASGAESYYPKIVP